jgi:hypothetical protein
LRQFGRILGGRGGDASAKFDGAPGGTGSHSEINKKYLLLKYNVLRWKRGAIIFIWIWGDRRQGRLAYNL